MTEQLPLCECGCGEPVAKKGNRYINGHFWKGKHHNEEAKAKMRKAKIGKNNPMSGKTGKDHHFYRKCHTDDSIEKMSKAKKGKYDGENNPFYGKEHSPETLTKMKESAKGKHDGNKNGMYGKRPSDKLIAKMKGGNDICDHHYIYDHSDLSKYTMKVTRAKHAQIHAWMRKAGIVVPHINVKEDN